MIDPNLLALGAGLLAVGALAGLSAGLFGIGGGAVMVPALIYAFDWLGYSDAVVTHCAVATSSAVIIPNAIRSVRGHNAKGAVDWSIIWPKNPLVGYAVWIGFGAFLTSLFVAPHLKGTTLTLIFGVLAIGIAAQFIVGRTQAILRQSVPRGIAPPVVGSAVGGISALIGIGGGSLTVPLMAVSNVPIHRAIGTASGIGLAIALPATLGYIASGWDIPGRPPGSLGYVNGVGFVLIAATAFLTIPLGVRLAHKLDQRKLKVIFGVCLLLIALNLICKSVLG